MDEPPRELRAEDIDWGHGRRTGQSPPRGRPSNEDGAIAFEPSLALTEADRRLLRSLGIKADG